MSGRAYYLVNGKRSNRFQDEIPFKVILESRIGEGKISLIFNRAYPNATFLSARRLDRRMTQMYILLSNLVDDRKKVGNFYIQQKDK